MTSPSAMPLIAYMPHSPMAEYTIHSYTFIHIHTHSYTFITNTHRQSACGICHARYFGWSLSSPSSASPLPLLSLSSPSPLPLLSLSLLFIMVMYRQCNAIGGVNCMEVTDHWVIAGVSFGCPP